MDLVKAVDHRRLLNVGQRVVLVTTVMFVVLASSVMFYLDYLMIEEQG